MSLYLFRVDVFDNEGKSSLHLAAETGSMEVCKLLLGKNAFVNSKTKKGLTALHFAAQKGHAELVEYLVKDYEADLESNTGERQTPLHLAAYHGQLETCKVLVNLDALVDAGDENDKRPIHLAAQNDHTEIINFFLTNRPSLVSSVTKDGNSLAHLAAKKGEIFTLNLRKIIK